MIGTQAANLTRQRAGSRRAILRRKNTILPGTLKLSAPVVSGALSLTAIASTGTLAGKVVTGSVFAIAGISGTYTATADSQASAGVITIAFTPAIPVGQSASTNAAVTFSQPHKEYSYPVLNRQVSAEDAARVDAGLQVRLLPFTPGLVAPDNGDLLDGIAIKEVRTVDTDRDGIAYYHCFVGVKP